MDLPGLVEMRRINQLRLAISRHPNQRGPVIAHMKGEHDNLINVDRAKYPELYEVKSSSLFTPSGNRNRCSCCGIFIYSDQHFCTDCSSP